MSVLPLTARERPGWVHRVRIDISGKPTSWAITEQVRTVSANRLTGRGPLYRLDVGQITEVGTVLAQMIDF